MRISLSSTCLAGCTATGDAAAGLGLPAASTLVDAVSATDACSALAPATDGVTEINASADGHLIYLVKGPGAVPPFDATLSANLHGTLTTTKGLPIFFGSPFTQAEVISTVDFTSGAPVFSFSDSVSDGGGFSPPMSPFFVDQSTASQAIFAIDPT